MLAASVYLLQELEPGLLLTAHQSLPSQGAGPVQEPCLSFNTVPCASGAVGSTWLREQEGS